MKGIVYLCALSKMSRVPKEDNHFFMTTRKNAKLKDARQTFELAPSPELFYMYNSVWKNHPAENWWDAYKEEYMKTVDMKFIQDLCDGLDLGHNITLMCYCGNDAYCHRSILKDIFSSRGYNCIEIR